MKLKEQFNRIIESEKDKSRMQKEAKSFSDSIKKYLPEKIIEMMMENDEYLEIGQYKIKAEHRIWGHNWSVILEVHPILENWEKSDGGTCFCSLPPKDVREEILSLIKKG